jgi:hypothetical protein
MNTKSRPFAGGFFFMSIFSGIQGSESFVCLPSVSAYIIYFTLKQMLYMLKVLIANSAFGRTEYSSLKKTTGKRK